MTIKTFVISLKRSEERRARIQAILDEGDIEFEFFDAIDAAEENFKYSARRAPKKTKIRFGYHLEESELACFASHLAVWEKCVKLNEPILVLEDNLQLTADFSQHYSDFSELALKYQYVKLSATHPKRYKVIEPLSAGCNIVYYLKRTCGTVGYLITPKACQQLISDYIEFVEPVDEYMGKPWKHGVLTYSVKPDLIARADVTSTIGSSRKNKTGLKIWNKVIIESFRLYEQIRNKIANLSI